MTKGCIAFVRDRRVRSGLKDMGSEMLILLHLAIMSFQIMAGHIISRLE